MRVLRKSGVRQPWQPAPLFLPVDDPNRPVWVVSGQMPIPGAVVLSVGAIRDGDRLPATVVVVAQGPLSPAGSVLVVPALRDTPSVSPDQLRPTTIVTSPVLLPLAIARTIGIVAIHDAPFGRFALTRIISQPIAPIPIGLSQFIGGLHGGAVVSRLPVTQVINTTVLTFPYGRLDRSLVYALKMPPVFAILMIVYPRNRIDVAAENRNPVVPRDIRVFDVFDDDRTPTV